MLMMIRRSCTCAAIVVIMVIAMIPRPLLIKVVCRKRRGGKHGRR